MRRLLMTALVTLVPVGAGAGWSSDPAVNTPVPMPEQFAVYRSDPLLARDHDGNLMVYWCEIHNVPQPPFPNQSFHAYFALLSTSGDVMLGPLEGGRIQTFPPPIAGSAVLPGIGTVVGLSLHFPPANYVEVGAFAPDGTTLWSTRVSGGPLLPGEVQGSVTGTGARAPGAVIAAFVTSGGIHAQRIGATGLREWLDTGQPVTDPLDGGLDPAVVSDGADGAIVVWTRSSTTSPQLVAQRLGPNGMRLWGQSGLPVAPGAGVQTGMVVVADGMGGAIVAWLDDRSGAPEVYAQRLDGQGTALWTAGGVRVATGPGVTRPRLVAEGGGAVLAWTDLRNGNADVYAQRLSAAGAPLWPATGLVVTAAPGDQTAPALVADETGGVILAWQDHRGATWDVYAQRLSPTGQGMWIDSGRPVSIAPDDQIQAALLADGTGGAYLAWADYRAGFDAARVYAAHVHATGVLPVALEGFSVE
jgi:hypothetical protein